jgi:hypothetical protein
MPSTTVTRFGEIQPPRLVDDGRRFTGDHAARNNAPSGQGMAQNGRALRRSKARRQAGAELARLHAVSMDVINAIQRIAGQARRVETVDVADLPAEQILDVLVGFDAGSMDVLHDNRVSASLVRPH